MKYYIIVCFVFVSVFGMAQTNSTKKEVVLTRITMDISEIQDPLLFGSSIDISLKPSKMSEKYATHTLLGSIGLDEIRTVQLDLNDQKMEKSAIISSSINLNFKSRFVDEFIGVFNFVFEFSDGTNYPFRFGRVAIGNDGTINRISRTIMIH
jgi:hypothetical protein